MKDMRPHCTADHLDWAPDPAREPAGPVLVKGSALRQVEPLSRIQQACYCHLCGPH
jgi:hypothetical protein